MDVTGELLKLEDSQFKDFSSKLIPNVPRESIIGIRTPVLRSFAKTIDKDSAEKFTASLPHRYHEENCLHGFLIENIGDYHETIKSLDTFLPYVNNWATCDSICPKVFKKHKDELYSKIKEWLCSNDTYTVRFALKMLMTHFLDKNFNPEVLELCAKVRSSEYYIKMMVAWFFATALAKQYEESVKYFELRKLDLFCHNKAIQKACESYRINDDNKAYLKRLKIKHE